MPAIGTQIAYEVRTIFKGFLSWLRFSGRVLLDLPYALKYRAETYYQIYILGNQAATLIALAAMFVSMALALEWSFQLDRFGAKSMLGGVLSNAVLREIGPLVVGLLMAARTSAEICSEIGNMVSSEEIDALKAFGTDPVKRLLVSRVFASTVVMAPLALIADSLGIISGWAASVTWAGIDPQNFWISAYDILYVKDLMLGVLKPTIYGFFVGLISTYFGYTMKGGAEYVGPATTDAVRYSSASVLILDFVITKVYNSLFP